MRIIRPWWLVSVHLLLTLFILCVRVNKLFLLGFRNQLGLVLNSALNLRLDLLNLLIELLAGSDLVSALRWRNLNCFERIIKNAFLLLFLLCTFTNQIFFRFYLGILLNIISILFEKFWVLEHLLPIGFIFFSVDCMSIDISNNHFNELLFLFW